MTKKRKINQKITEANGAKRTQKDGGRNTKRTQMEHKVSKQGKNLQY